MKDLLIEILTEEIPAGYIEPALDAIQSLMTQKLFRARIVHGAMKVFGTPRRLALMVRDVAEKQASVKMEVVGPPRTVAFDAEGRPTKAAEGFAKSQGVSVKRLTTKTTDKGEYACVRKTERGQSSRKLLQTIIPEVITAIPFPKAMRWSDLKLVFARPIHGILALLGDRIVPFKLENIRSGRRTVGHRFMHPKGVAIANASEYVPTLRCAYVLVDIDERKKVVREEITKAAREFGGEVLPDEELLVTVTHLVEYAAVSRGTFDESFLEVPREVLITAMREHQKYFAVVGSDDRLMPSFIAVNNTPAQDIDVVTSGHERVLRARLEDARFFYAADGKKALQEIVDRLKGVLFQARLGTMYEKACRIQKMAGHLADLAAPDLKVSASRAAWLCKADLTTQMVNEFPKLQGVMGRVYATNSGEPEAVARAIEEHYLPAYAGGPRPATVTGTLVSIADKLDTICGCFGVGLIPSGTSDPYALRRQAIGVIHMMSAEAISVSLGKLIDQSLAFLGDKVSEDKEGIARKVLTFFQHRMEYLLAEEGFSKDVIAAIVSASIDPVPAVWQRTRALEALKSKPDFQPLAVAFKRVANIIRQAEQRGEIAPGADRKGLEPDPGVFQATCESVLYDALKKVEGALTEDLQAGAFDRALLTVASLKEPVDAFFDGVMVLSDDERLKQNRLALLGAIAGLFSNLADFSKIST
jgi:glycyl-tRNA synthetase beta chain